MKKLEQQYFSRKEVANYFWISVQSLLKVMYSNWIKETLFNTCEWWNKLIRIHKSQIDKLESKLKTYE